ncbi:uncharacterized protein LOC142323950 isoform X1 [Lycorma delicatula]|uniref:uncharacterized protein LOC142323950 isoform X1 n=1 Tax=Lycorma delicatula TaxID=130591 RepID=UPI003F511B26
MADQPDEPMDLTDLPLPSRSNEPMETQDAVASTSATLHSLSHQQSLLQNRRHRNNVSTDSVLQHPTAARKSDTERKRNYRLRKAANLALASGSLESTTATSSRSRETSNDVQTGTQRQLTYQQRQTLAAEPAQTTVQPGTTSDQIKVQQAQSTWNTKWASSLMRCKSKILATLARFATDCVVQERPQTHHCGTAGGDLGLVQNPQLCREEYDLVCNTCKRSLNKKSMPPLAKVNGFSYPDQPQGLNRWIPSVND